MEQGIIAWLDPSESRRGEVVLRANVDWIRVAKLQIKLTKLATGCADVCLEE